MLNIHIHKGRRWFLYIEVLVYQTKHILQISVVY